MDSEVVMKRVLVGLDGSARSSGVLDAAVSVASKQGARVILLRVVGLPRDVPQDFFKITDEPLVDVLRRRAKSYLDECMPKVPADLFGGIEIGVGTPWEGICKMAQSLEAELIVVGSHGYSGWDRLLGTTAAKVVNHAPCSVLVVRERPGDSPAGKTPTGAR
jgi:nucleotide-binding universal stress UspA family protein